MKMHQHSQQSAKIPEATRSTLAPSKLSSIPVLYSMQRSLGNQEMSGHSPMQAKSNTSPSGNRYEKEADTVAAKVLTPFKNTVPASPRISPIRSSDVVEHSILQGKTAESTNLSGQGSELSSFTNDGQPLPEHLRSQLEPRFGRDFQSVRLHHDANAARLSKSINAKALTMGNHILFGKGYYSPETTAGKTLLAHELTHTIQQGALGKRLSASGQNAFVQRQEETASPGTNSMAIDANEIFPFPQGSQILLGRIIPDWIFNILSSSKDVKQQQMVGALQAIHGLQATVITATPDLFAAKANTAVTIPAHGDQEERRLRDLTMQLSRTGNNFTFSLTAIEGDATSATPLMPPQTGLTAQRSEGGFILSSQVNGQTVPQLRVSREDDSSIIEVFTQTLAPEVSSMIPKLRVIAMNQLPDAKEEADVQRAADRILNRQASHRRTRRQQFTLGGGTTLIGGEPAELVTSSWMIRFPATSIAALFTKNPQVAAGVGALVNIPLETQLLYTPPSSVLGTVSSGVGFHLPISVPVNLSILGGVGGGNVAFPTAFGRERRGVFGPTFGGAAGIELGRWRINVRADHLFNMIKDAEGGTTGITTFSGNLGVGF